ncbi:hypothetical protein [Candidatus Contendibacter odensensis]|uniref:Uncharacterized protein n=1 Tax=Candidatus Contendobacter odensis Run_B_J11 TaxID=1400861 RepID=A0A7U7G8J2_9GAMM|nr:hypothetical protein [Candidatus Contendobacter odensis]CDH43838.1 hypothetical protein BN874_1370003 [Candidatus Contendobacter odensis Run_B_J11]
MTTNLLYDINISEISLVDRAANEDARIILFKRDDDPMYVAPEMPAPLSYVATETPAPSSEVTPEIIAKSDDDELQGRLTALSKSLDDLAAENLRLSADNTNLTAEIAKRAALEEPEDVMKGLPEPVAKRIEAIEKRAADAELLVKRLTDHAEETASIAKAAKYAAIPATADDLGKLLLRIRKGMTTPADADEVERILDAASAGMADVVAGPVGKSADKASGGTAMDRLDGTVAALRSANPDLTQAQAFTKALADNPSLYTDYLAERK